MRAIDPITIKTTDGQERKFLLTMGGVRRLKARFNAKSLGDILQQDAEAAGVPILYEALLDKGELATEEQFADVLPAHLEDVIEAVVRLLGVSLPDKKPRDPTNPTPGTVQ